MTDIYQIAWLFLSMAPLQLQQYLAIDSITDAMRISLAPMFVVEFPAKYVILTCHTNMNTSAISEIKWTEGYGHDKLVLSKNKAGQEFKGSEYKNTAFFGEGCSLVLTNHRLKPNVVNIYTVRINNGDSHFFNATTKLVVHKETAAKPVQETSWVTIHLHPLTMTRFPAKFVNISCTYEKSNQLEKDNILWTEENANGLLVLERNTAGVTIVGKAYSNTVQLGDGCSLIFRNHMFKPNNVYRYTVRIDTLYTFRDNSDSTQLVVTEAVNSTEDRGTAEKDDLDNIDIEVDNITSKSIDVRVTIILVVVALTSFALCGVGSYMCYRWRNCNLHRGPSCQTLTGSETESEIM